jgi:hypothetical protein
MNRLAFLEPGNTGFIASPVHPFGRRLGLATMVGVAAAGAFLVGGVLGLSRSGSYNHSRGACIALEFAENFGAVGTTQKRQTLRALTSSAGRYPGLFPKSVEELEDLCIRTLASEARFAR